MRPTREQAVVALERYERERLAAFETFGVGGWCWACDDYAANCDCTPTEQREAHEDAIRRGRAE